MPLLHSGSQSAFKTNVKTLMGDIGKSPHVKDRSQALAIAYATKRRAKGYALGGPPGPWASTTRWPSWFVRNEARAMTHSGPILSAVSGRTDRHNMAVESQSYVFPSSHVGALGQHNTLAGMKVLNQMFRMGPYDTAASPIRHGPGLPKPPRPLGVMTDRGGARGEHAGAPVDVVTAGGEFVVPPHKILEWLARNGLPQNLKYGHAMLDAWVNSERKKDIHRLKKLPGPAKS